VVLTRKGAHHLRQGQCEIVHRDAVKHTASSSLVDKANYRHFMAKEIRQSSRKWFGHTLARYVDMATDSGAAGATAVRFQEYPADRDRRLRHPSYAAFVANTGSSGWRACPSSVDVDSEFRYASRRCAWRSGDFHFAIRRDATRWRRCGYAKSQGAHTLSVVTVATSTIGGKGPCADLVGPVEIGVGLDESVQPASLMVLASLAVAAGQGARRIVRETRPSWCMAS